LGLRIITFCLKVNTPRGLTYQDVKGAGSRVLVLKPGFSHSFVEQQAKEASGLHATFKLRPRPRSPWPRPRTRCLKNGASPVFYENSLGESNVRRPPKPSWNAGHGTPLCSTRSNCSVLEYKNDLQATGPLDPWTLGTLDP
jgi:hypothetical protein